MTLLNQKPERIHARNRFGETPLHLAARFGWTQTRELLKRRPDLSALTPLGRSPLHGSIWKEVKGDVNATDNIYGWTPLHYAVDRNAFEMAWILLNRSADPNRKDTNGFTPPYSRRM